MPIDYSLLSKLTYADPIELESIPVSEFITFGY